MPDEPRLEEQALSEAAEMAIAAQLDAVENIDVAVRTDVLKIVQGRVDSVSIAAQEAFQCTQGEGISLELALTFLNKARELMDLPYFQLEGIALRLKKMDV